MIDPRLAVVDRRFEAVERILAVTGGKGGIGKSVVATLLALTLARTGRRVGLLDLDLTGPCDHRILGVGDRFPTEAHGIEPPCHDGIHFMSISYFGGDRPAPLRGPDSTNAMLELLAITSWGGLDVLVLDLPPGVGDVALDALRLVPRAEYLVVATASRIVLDTVGRTLRLLAGVDATVAGVIENMQREATSDVRDLADDHAAVYLGSLPWCDGLESAIGDTDRLARTAVADAMREVVARLFGGSALNRSGEAPRR